jgi:hypothetical protein
MNKCAKLLDHKIITKILSVVQVLKQLIVLFLRPHVFEVFVLTLLLVG